MIARQDLVCTYCGKAIKFMYSAPSKFQQLIHVIGDNGRKYEKHKCKSSEEGFLKLLLNITDKNQ